MIVKIPGINGLGKTEGCKNSGDKIINLLEEIHSRESGEEIKLDSIDIGNIDINTEDINSQMNEIYEKSLDFFSKNREERTIFLGGDHSISFPICKGFKENFNNPVLIVFDAHADCMDPMKEPTHEEWLRALIEEGFPPENVLLVGVRNLWKDEEKFLRENNIRRVFMDNIENRLEEIGDIITEFSQGRPLYVSFDIDVLDPAFAPSTGYLEPGGITSRQLIYLVKRINKIRNLKGVDIVEIDTNKDEKFNFRTAKIGSKILVELI